MHALYYTDVQNLQQKNQLNHYTKRRKLIFSGWTTIGGMSYLKSSSTRVAPVSAEHALYVLAQENTYIKCIKKHIYFWTFIHPIL